ncbi:dipeptidase [Sediminitomix flava]|uniref:Dipeptidase n=1 Tax=Sediminitomix flava TaxID=379075 RepID=A0A315ZCT8_SEDFL|nr:C69 family dipeptidase [Sediminitomix flava]PWJ43120.1 dipeptidase [Sediminitomix flava]
MKKNVLSLLGLFVLGLFAQPSALACTSIMVTKGATKDGSNMITYAADSHVLFGELYFYPAMTYPEGTMLDVIDWDTGKPLGQIPQVAQTYSVVGNMNEHQLAITESTFGGRKECQGQNDGIIDYGSLIYITLQRAKTAREAITIMGELVNTYGYYSSGESFSISDKNEVWYMELIGKGEGEKGAVWVARRVPNGYVAAHANQARIGKFPQDDKENCLYSADVIEFAKNKGWYKGKDKDFDFAEVYAPVDFGGARFCDARVWSIYNRLTDGMDKFTAYAEGKLEKDEATGFTTNKLPLWVKPSKKLSVQDVMELMRDHYEGTPLDMTQDAGAGAFDLPYRWRGLTWEYEGKEYFNERAISTQQTGFSLVAQSRASLPDPIGGILWFGVDDTYSTVYTPMYCGMTEVPETFEVGNGDMLTYSETSAFWIFNTVSNFAYLRYSDMIQDIREKQKELETKFVDYTAMIDKSASEMFEESPEKARAFVTDFSVTTANKMVMDWKKFGQQLIVKYMDGNVKKQTEKGQFERSEYGQCPSPNFPGYSEQWKKQVVEDTEDRLEVKE